MDELTSVFIQEGREQLQAMETGLLDLEQQPDNHDNINGIFRAAHTIKGRPVSLNAITSKPSCTRSRTCSIACVTARSGFRTN